MEITDINFINFKTEDTEELITFFTSETWPFHSNPNPNKEKVAQSISEGIFINEFVKTFWIEYQDEKIGLIKLFDLEDDIPLFDLRIKEKYRGRGLGEVALKWLVKYVFNDLDFQKMEGTTRHDNKAMRRTFIK